MGHLGGLFILISCITQHHIIAHTLPACHQQLEFRCKHGSCIPKEKLCDRHKDCDDGSDEQLCGLPRCKKDEFSCFNSRRCLPSNLLCNGVEDCGDGSDEDSCPSCATGLFSCGPSDGCLLMPRLCDGHVDCKDGRDEIQEFCALSRARPQSAPSCLPSEFDCGDGKCILHTWRCDNKADCPDDSDENNCEQNECLVNNGGCSHHCVDTAMGFHCECPDHMRLVGNSYCEEVDICLENDFCDQLCIHSNDTLACDCLDGYHMIPMSRDCKAKGVDAQLLVSTSQGVVQLVLSGAASRMLAVHRSGPGPLAALASNNTLYMAHQRQGSIYRVHLSGKAQHATLLMHVPSPVSGLTVDWIHHLLYWTSLESDSINVSLLDGSTQRQLITGLDTPCALTVDPLHGLLFWAQCGSLPKIERANLGGQDTMTLVSSLLQNPVALTLDMPRQLLYWLDRGMRSISRVTLDGHHRKTVVESNGYLDQPFDLAVFEGFVYWSDQDTHSVCRANKHSGSDFQLLLTNVSSAAGIAIIQPALQPNSNAPCGKPGRVCKHDCIVDLLSETLSFSCVGKGNNPSQGIPAISRTIPASRLSDLEFTGILSVIVFLSVLLVGTFLWWWRVGFRPARNLTEQSFSLKESQDPLIHGPRECLSKETLKLDLDSE
ncbi:low-density lipoprotein receptor-related protein 8-like isoform X2 [Corythoichthys intestinalis]|uniref:low-density lipoprotein receptor-related protein 8-like isoform X2 n=1 Tax=Corythoichthys intestinalis TaxID=161448 RepID=UPI0025A6848A|nr:low-density lipoprotein receptor-related protein 8-like isoform X2 [Corythoichthys intestinalis]